MPWTVTLLFSRLTRSTLPRLPLSSPAMTSTMSLMRICMGSRGLFAFLVHHVLAKSRVVLAQFQAALGVVPVLLNVVAVIAFGADDLDVRPGVFRFLGHGTHLWERFKIETALRRVKGLSTKMAGNLVETGLILTQAGSEGGPRSCASF